MKTLGLLLISCCAVLAQSVTDVQVLINASVVGVTSLATITASQGDGTVCRINKLAGPVISATFKCNSASGSVSKGPSILNASGTVVMSDYWGLGDVFCLIAINPTTAVVTVGSIGSVPANGIAWNCSMNIKTGGQAAVNGTAVWP